MFVNIVNRVQQILKETTYSDNIAYLPNGFSSVSQILKNLAGKKKQWKITVHENEDSYEVALENELKVTVPVRYWADFKARVLTDERYNRDTMVVDLSDTLLETSDDKVDKLYTKLKRGLTNLMNKSPISEVRAHATIWRQLFNVAHYSLAKGTLFRLDSSKDLQAGIESTVNRARGHYLEDRGSIEMIISAIDQERPLNTFDVFDEYEILVATRIHSKYSGVDMVYEGGVTMAFVPFERVYLTNTEVQDEIGVYKDVRVAKNVIYPVGKTFDRGFFKNLKASIDDVVE